MAVSGAGRATAVMEWYPLARIGGKEALVNTALALEGERELTAAQERGCIKALFKVRRPLRREAEGIAAMEEELSQEGLMQRLA